MPPNPLAHPFAHPFAPPLAATATATATQTAATTSTSNPTLPTLSAFLHSHFPTLSPQASAAEVPWLYHSPLPPRPNTQTPRPLPSKLPVEKLVLSITPTEGMYTALGAAPPPPLIHNTGTPTTSSLATPLAPAHPPAPRPTRLGTAASFLHRPWTLTRARLPRGTTVFSSHKGFDEALTVGCNFALLERLGLDISPDALEVLVGYKGDEGRRVGVVAGWQGGGVVDEREARARVEGEFGGLDGEGGWFGFSEDGGEEGVGVKAVACMNAFHPEELERVANAALQRGYVADAAKCEGLVYLTGAVREEGLKAARERGMRVVCVGHRRCEVWGVGYLAGRVRERWPGLEVRVVDEEEVKVEKVAKKKGSGKGNGKGKGNEKNGKQEGNVGREHTRGQEEQKEEDMSKKRKVAEDESEDGGVAL